MQNPDQREVSAVAAIPNVNKPAIAQPSVRRNANDMLDLLDDDDQGRGNNSNNPLMGKPKAANMGGMDDLDDLLNGLDDNAPKLTNKKPIGHLKTGAPASGADPEDEWGALNNNPTTNNSKGMSPIED